MRRIAVFATALAGGALIAAACGGSGAKPAASTMASASTTAPAATAIAGSGTQVPVGTGVAIVGSPLPTYTPSPVSGAQQTAIAQGTSVPLADFKDPKGRFVVGLPVGWTIQSDMVGVSASLAGHPIAADLGIACAPGATVPALIAADKSLLKRIGDGDLTLDKEFPTTVDGITAREVPWQGVVQAVNITVKHWYVYFEAKGCAWRLLLNTYPGANEQDMLVIFRRVLDSFRLQ